MRADRGMRVEHVFLLLVGQLVRQLARPAERVLDRREQLDEARASLEQLGELLGASAAAVARARVRGDQERDVVVALAELDLQLDALEER